MDGNAVAGPPAGNAAVAGPPADCCAKPGAEAINKLIKITASNGGLRINDPLKFIESADRPTQIRNAIFGQGQLKHIA
jgi:hypothetical protein